MPIANSLLDFLRDPTWQFVGAAFAVIAIIVTLRQRQRKALTYQVKSTATLLTASEEIASRVKVFFDSAEVNDIRLWLIEVKNSGNAPISMADFEKPLQLTFGDSARVLSVAVIDKRPDDLPAEVETRDSSVVLIPLLLNAGDRLLVKALVTNAGEIDVTARVNGVSRIQRISDPDAPMPKKLLWGLFIFVVSAAASVGLSPQLEHSAFREPLSTLFVVSAALVFVWLIEYVSAITRNFLKEIWELVSNGRTKK